MTQHIDPSECMPQLRSFLLFRGLACRASQRGDYFDAGQNYSMAMSAAWMLSTAIPNLDHTRINELHGAVERAIKMHQAGK